MSNFFTPGRKVITFYFLLAYIMPLIGNSIFSDSISTPYKIFPFSVYAIIMLLCSYLLYWIFSSIRFSSSCNRQQSVILRGLSNAYSRSRLIIAISSILIGLLNLEFGLTSYRYQAIGMSEQHHTIILFLGVILNQIAILDLFYHIFCNPYGSTYRDRKYKISTYCFLLAMFLLANGIGTMFLAMFTAMCVFLPNLSERMIFGNRSQKAFINLKGIVKQFVWLIIFCLIFWEAWVIGGAIKHSSGQDSIWLTYNANKENLLITWEFVKNYLLYLISSLSTAYYSLLYVTHVTPSVLRHGHEFTALIPLNTFLYRLDFLLGHPFGVAKDSISSISRLNYRLLVDTTTYSMREGTSPGLLASFVYLFSFPFSVIFSSCYLAWLSRLYDVLLFSPRFNRVSWLGVFFVLQFTQSLFQSVGDFLLIIDDTLITLVVLLVFKRIKLTALNSENCNSRSFDNRYAVRWEDSVSVK